MVLAGIFAAEVLAGLFAAGAGAIVRDGTDASPLLGRLLGELHDLFATEVLPLLDPTDIALLARACWKCGEAVLWSGVEIAGETEDRPLKVEDFLGSVELLAWGKDNGCPWNRRTCALAAGGGHMVALRWAREHGCEWNARTCASAARGGHMEVLVWAREHHCPWDKATCEFAARGGHLEVLVWAREHGCAWNVQTTLAAAEAGHLAVLQWAREHGATWDHWTCPFAALGGHLEVMQWAREHGVQWIEDIVLELAAAGGHQEKLARWLVEHGAP
jgi:hypothetical protein